jgi:hypothetical protein
VGDPEIPEVLVGNDEDISKDTRGALERETQEQHWFWESPRGQKSQGSKGPDLD